MGTDPVDFLLFRPSPVGMKDGMVTTHAATASIRRGETLKKNDDIQWNQNLC